MNSLSRYFPSLGVCALLTVSSPLRGAAAGPYRLIAEIPVGGDGGWDYLTVDEGARRLYVSHATEVVVLDLDANAVVGAIADTPGVHGLAVASELKRGFTSNGRENKAGMVDLTTLKTLAKVDTGENPDAMLYEPGRKEVYMFNARGLSATVFGRSPARCSPRFRLAENRSMPWPIRRRGVCT